ncbi:hypothetical protein AWZ03_015343, partial [Drosophila navojoa]
SSGAAHSKAMANQQTDRPTDSPKDRPTVTTDGTGKQQQQQQQQNEAINTFGIVAMATSMAANPLAVQCQLLPRLLLLL